MSSEIERAMDLRKVLEEQILDDHVELTLREMLGITKKEFHAMIINLMKRKQLLIEQESMKPIAMSAVAKDDVAVEEEHPDSHYTRLH